MSKTKVSKVRASRDGHQFHEEWVVRNAFKLLLGQDDLYAIAIEGISPEDSFLLNPNTIEIADSTLYFGNSASLKSADFVEIIQYKYSIADADNIFQPSDARDVLVKFAVFESEIYGNAIFKKIS